MQLERYDVDADTENNIYAFWSVGPKGRIAKVVIFQKLEEDLYNLAFGDWNFEKVKLNDLARTDNGDTQKVLATVAHIVKLFLLSNRTATLRISGSTPARVRLYQMGIAAYYSEVIEHFEVLGLYEACYEQFVRGINYAGFSVRNKQTS